MTAWRECGNGVHLRADTEPPAEVIDWLEDHTDIKAVAWDDGHGNKGTVAWP